MKKLIEQLEEMRDKIHIPHESLLRSRSKMQQRIIVQKQHEAPVRPFFAQYATAFVTLGVILVIITGYSYTHPEMVKHIWEKIIDRDVDTANKIDPVDFDAGTPLLPTKATTSATQDQKPDIKQNNAAVIESGVIETNKKEVILPEVVETNKPTTTPAQATTQKQQGKQTSVDKRPVDKPINQPAEDKKPK